MADVELSDPGQAETPEVAAQVAELLRRLNGEEEDPEATLTRFRAQLGDRGIELDHLLSPEPAADSAAATRAGSADLVGVLGALLGSAVAKPKPKPAAGSASSGTASPLEQLAKQLGLTPAALLEMLKPALTNLLTGKKPKQSSSSKPKPKPGTTASKPKTKPKAKPKPESSTTASKPKAKPKPESSTTASKPKTKPKPESSATASKPKAKPKAKPKPSATASKPKAKPKA